MQLTDPATDSNATDSPSEADLRSVVSLSESRRERELVGRLGLATLNLR